VTRPAFSGATFCNAFSRRNEILQRRIIVLVVSRKENESIRIEPLDDVDPSLTLHDVFAQGAIVLTLTHVGARRVRLVIEAPNALRISRSEGAGANAETSDTPASVNPRRIAMRP
jgi:sRNA-binding carbon storage regulator CsrA